MADAADATGVIVTVNQLALVVGVATFGTLYLNLAGRLPLQAAGGFRALSAHAAVVTCVVLAGGAVAGGVLAFARGVLARRRAEAAAALRARPRCRRALTPGRGGSGACRLGGRAGGVAGPSAVDPAGVAADLGGLARGAPGTVGWGTGGCRQLTLPGRRGLRRTPPRGAGARRLLRRAARVARGEGERGRQADHRHRDQRVPFGKSRRSSPAPRAA